MENNATRSLDSELKTKPKAPGEHDAIDVLVPKAAPAHYLFGINAALIVAEPRSYHSTTSPPL